MISKQENASVDSSAVIEGIVDLFRAVNLQRMANAKLYVGIPFSILTEIHKALQLQRTEDENQRFRNRLRYAGIAGERTEDTFKWDNDTYPLAETGIIEQVLTIDFIKDRKNLIMVGPPGTGKSLLAVIVACKALRENYSVKYKTTHEIAMELREVRAGNSLSGYIKRIQSCDVLIIEDLSFASFNLKAAQSFFAIIDGRYERKKTTVITSNGSIRDWVEDFPEKRMKSALLGRFFENALLVNMNGARDMRLEKAKEKLGYPLQVDSAGEQEERR